MSEFGAFGKLPFAFRARMLLVWAMTLFARWLCYSASVPCILIIFSYEFGLSFSKVSGLSSWAGYRASSVVCGFANQVPVSLISPADFKCGSIIICSMGSLVIESNTQEKEAETERGF